MNEWPITIMADGCSTNAYAGNKISECSRLIFPSIRCVGPAADGPLKRLTNSKTMNVSEISEFVPPFRTILRHFQQSGKSSCLLNEALGMLDMKTVHIMSFCPTRMAYLLYACAQVVDLLLPICDILTSSGIRKDESDIFLSPKSMIIMHLLAD